MAGTGGGIWAGDVQGGAGMVSASVVGSNKRKD